MKRELDKRLSALESKSEKRDVKEGMKELYKIIHEVPPKSDIAKLYAKS